jgi:hypothetical protein
MWYHVNSIEDIPADRDLRLAVMDGDGMHELVFPCRRLGASWVDAKTRRPVEVYPTHWQEWPQKPK